MPNGFAGALAKNELSGSAIRRPERQNPARGGVLQGIRDGAKL
jgi:hypothetical protein